MPASRPPRVTGSETLFRGWGTLRRHTLETGHTREVYDHGHAVAALVRDPARDTVLLVRQHRLPIALHGADLAGEADRPDGPGAGRSDGPGAERPDGMSVEVPAGLIDEGETPERTMRREIEEETGHRVGDLAPVADLFASPGSLSERMVLFTATYGPDTKVGEGGGLAGEGEDIEVLEVPLAEALRMVEDGRIRDLKTAFLVLWAARDRSS